MICKLCNKSFETNHKLSNHIKKYHIEFSNEDYYKINYDKSEFCICGKKLKFVNLTKGFRQSCGDKLCTDKVRYNHIKDSFRIKYNVSNPGQIESVKLKVKKTNLERYNVTNVFQKPSNREKSEKTCLEKYGTKCALQNKEVRELGKDKQELLYGKRMFFQTSIFKNGDPERKFKLKELTKAKYDKDYLFETDYFKQTSYDTKKNNGSFGSSSYEEYLNEALISYNLKIERNYKDDQRYPFQCDFYIPSIDLFIEINGHDTHNFKFFESSNEDHILELEEIKIKAINKKLENPDRKNKYEVTTKIWSESDPLKLKTALDNKLNYLVLWSMKDIKRFLKDDIDISFTHEACSDELKKINKIVPSYNKPPAWNKIILTYQKHFYKHERILWKENLDIRAKLLMNRSKYLNKKISEITDYELLSGFKKSGIHYGYSHMSPFYIKKFILDYNIKSIYDPFGGWGQRLLGSGNISYIYNDIDTRSCCGISNIIRDFNLQNKIVYNKDASKFVPDEDYEAVFTCSPYFNLEKYDNLGISNNNNYDDFLNWWRDVIKCSLKKSTKYFCFVIDSKNKESMINICLEFNLELLEENILFKKQGNLTKNKGLKKNSEYLIIMKTKLYN